MKTNFMGVGEAAAVLGVGQEEIYRLIRSDELPLDVWNGRVYVDEEAVRALLAQQRSARLHPMDRTLYGRGATGSSRRASPHAEGRRDQLPTKTPQAKAARAEPSRQARPRTMAQMRDAGVRFAGDEALEAAAAKPAQAGGELAGIVETLVGCSTLRSRAD